MRRIAGFVAGYVRKFLGWTVSSGQSSCVVDEYVDMSADTQSLVSNALDVFVRRFQGQDKRVSSKLLEFLRKSIMSADCSNDLWVET